MMKKVIVAAIATVFAISAHAQSASKDERDSDKLDLKNLEAKYWSAKDTDFTVVQNRTYNKANKVFASLGYGPLVNDAYSYGRMTNFAAGYYWSERMGAELAYETGAIRDSDSTDVFINENGFAPDFNRFISYTSLNFIIVPFYAKMSFWDRKIMYFDMQFGFGVGTMKYQIVKVDNAAPPADRGDDSSEDASTIGYNFDITQQLFFHENFAVRFDIKNKWSSQDSKRYFLNGNQERDLGKKNQQDTTVLLGVTVFY